MRSVHDPFTRATGEPDEADEPEKVAGQNIVCARTSAGYPIANKPVMPKDTARLENLRIARRMPAPLLNQAMFTLSLHNIWLQNCNGSKKSAATGLPPTRLDRAPPCGLSSAPMLPRYSCARGE